MTLCIDRGKAASGSRLIDSGPNLDMPIDYRKIRNITARDIENALFRDGYLLIHSTGSHRRYLQEETGRRVSISWHGRGNTFRIGTLRSIIEAQAQWTDADLIRLGLMRD